MSAYLSFFCNSRATLVESIPEDLTFPSGSPAHLSIYQDWKNLTHIANETIDTALFYWSLHSNGIYKDPFDWQVVQIFVFIQFVK